MNQFDYNQCIALEQLYDNVLNMQQYIKSIESLFRSGELQVANYKSGTLGQYKIDKLIKKEEIQENIEEKVETNSCSREELEEIEKKRIEELQKQLGNVSTPEEYLKIANEIGLENLDPTQQQIVIELETAKQNGEVVKGIGKGLYEVGKDLVTGIYDFVTHPKETIESVVHAVTHPKETYNYLSKAISDSYERDMVNGDAYSRAYWVTYAVGTVATSLIGTKGVGSVTKTGIASTKATVKTGVDKTKTVIKETPFSRLLPYAPHHQMALAGVNHVPYNTVNSVGLRDQLLSMAKVETKGTGNTVSDYLDDIVEAGSVNVTKMNKLKNAIQNNTFSVDELSEISKKMSELGITKEYDEVLIKIDFGKYLRGLIGAPPTAMIDPHAHHILFKKGLGQKQQELVREGQAILKKYGIEPIIGEENLVWAPNRIAGQHSIERLQHIVDKLKEVDSFGGTREKIVEMLKLLGEEAASMK
ncbi:type VII secretion protein [Peribacillus asahii]|uniref:Type VII secretion protein n=1 Tax=Peribacillus asahii TaxID=228899 RepID=A0A3T0KUE3_9BACI|nr:AHH domain-containing protein [Peribacillus asahii]AZV43938.1 type VII secretion protein [Peribacillus asahii]USK83681.1 type VII secretion protein [Peribacillus asahii]